VTAPIVAVTVLEDRAAITRRGSFALAGGQQRLVIERVSPVLVDKTLNAICANARVLDVRCERYVAPWREDAEPSPAATLRAERTALAAKRDLALARGRAAQTEAVAVAELAAAALADLAVAATRGAATPDAPQRLAELDTAEAAARAKAVEAELEVADLVAALGRLDDRLARAEAEAGEQAARLVIDVIAERATDAVVTATYVVPGAAWRPYHRARLERNASRLEWQTTACLWQATGEDWTDIELTCSLERPSLGVEPPELADDALHARKKPETLAVEAREQEHDTTGEGGGAAEVPGIDDGGLGLRLVAPRVTVRADGTPHRVGVGGFTTQVQLSHVAVPLRSPWVHLRARVINAGAQPLLAGPVDLIMASGYVGRTEVGFVAPGEKLYLGFGPDADLRLHRTQSKDRDDAGLLGGWNVQTVRIAVRMSNLGAERREVVVTERVPISEVEQVEVHTSAPDAYLLEDSHGEDITQVTARALDERGLVTWSVELPPHGRRAVTLEYKIKSQRGVAGV
jgi:diphthamide synthase (EF-2-diphthine--ammonia ligase)